MYACTNTGSPGDRVEFASSRRPRTRGGPELEGPELGGPELGGPELEEPRTRGGPELGGPELGEAQN